MIKKFNDFIKESYNGKSGFYLINESQESKSQADAIKLVMDRFGWDKEKANNFVRVDLRNDITSLRDKQIGKFTLGVARMYCDRQITDAGTISNLNATLKLLSAHLNEYDRNLNGLSAEELISKFEQTRENNVKKEKSEISKMKFGVSDYEIVKIDSYNDATKYYKYTNPNSRWCLTHMKDMYDSYTCDGMNQIYFCLKNGFENIKPIVGENAPLDEYGLSMLSIIVNEDGELAYCTCRWNHDNDGNDSIMNAVEISKVINVNFYETFKPNNKWKDMVDNVKQRLSNGENPKKIFKRVLDCGEEGFFIVELKIKANYYKYNIINTDYKIISDKWFDEVNDFVNGFSAVKIKNKGWNFINTEGKIISDKWYFYAWDFFDGFAIVKDKNKGYNFINTKGKYISDDWFDNAWDFDEGYAHVKLNKKWNFIDKNGKYILDDWFEDAYEAVRYFDKYLKK